jgi:hypothetical protein
MMKLLLIPVGLLVVGAIRAGPVDQAIMAAMRVADQPNYGWTSMVTDDARTYDLEGKTQKGGYTWMRFPKIKTISLRLGREADEEIEAVFNGATAVVIRTDDGWKTIAELPRARRDWTDDPFFWPAPPPMPVAMSPRAGHMSRSGGFGPIDPLDPAPIAWPMVPVGAEEEKRPYSNAQFALSRPHDELAIIVSSYVDMDVAGDIAGGTLSDMGARLLLVHEGQEDQIRPIAAAGTFKLQIKDGLVVKYLLRLEGIVLVDKKTVHVHQSSSTTIKDVGKSGFDVTDEIRRKLSR